MSENSPKNLEEALKLIVQLQTENTQLHEEIKKLEVVANNLSEMLAKSRKMMFGRTSEQIKNMYGHEQLSFFNEAEQEYSVCRSSGICCYRKFYCDTVSQQR